MPSIKRIILDVLKPHQPNVLDFARRIADLEESYRVKVTVEEIDDRTESIILSIEAENIDFDKVVETISNMGGSVHSIDEVEVSGSTPPGQDVA